MTADRKRDRAVYVMMSEDERAFLDELAKRNDMTLRQLIVSALRAFARVDVASKVEEIERRVAALEARP